MQVEYFRHDACAEWTVGIEGLTHVVTVPDMFRSDGLTIAEPIKRIVGLESYEEVGRLHDWLYTTCQFSRAISDGILRDALIERGCSWWKAWACWIGVRIGAAKHYDRE